MAEPLTELIGDALLRAVHLIEPKLGRRGRATLAWLQEAARPPHGVRLVSDDGTTYTGLALVERSELVILLAARHEPGRPAPVADRAPPRHLPMIPDPDDPRWDRDVGPYPYR